MNIRDGWKTGIPIHPTFFLVLGWSLFAFWAISIPTIFLADYLKPGDLSFWQKLNLPLLGTPCGLILYGFYLRSERKNWLEKVERLSKHLGANYEDDLVDLVSGGKNTLIGMAEKVLEIERLSKSVSKKGDIDILFREKQATKAAFSEVYALMRDLGLLEAGYRRDHTLLYKEAEIRFLEFEGH